MTTDTWTPAATPPPWEHDEYDWLGRRSAVVLIVTDRFPDRVQLAYRQQIDDEYAPRWHLVGPDAYEPDGNVTHWRDCPAPPSKEIAA